MTQKNALPTFSEFIQGCMHLAQWDLSNQECLSWIESLVSMGITTFDHAHVYGDPPCETLFGRALRLNPALRNQIQIISKCGIELPTPRPKAKQGVNTLPFYDTSKQAIFSSVDQSLKRLGIEQLDVLLIHRPDFLMQADEVAETFDHLFRDGKVASFGVSNFLPHQVSLLQSFLSYPLVTNQVEISPLQMRTLEDGTLDQLQEKSIRPMAWSCLGGGKIFDPDSNHLESLRHTLIEIGNEIGASSPVQVVWAWVRSCPAKPIPVLGTGKRSRVQDALGSIFLSLSRRQWYQIWSAAKGHRVP